MLLLRAGALAAMAAAMMLAQSTSGYPVAGALVNALTGEPVAGAEVELEPEGQSDGQSPLAAKADDRGRFAFYAIPAGRYRLMAWRRGYSRQALDEHSGWSTAVVTGAKLDTTHIVFRMKPEASIRTRVLDEDGELVRSAQVYLFEKQIREGRSETQMVRAQGTENRGITRFSNLEPGTYFLAVSARPWYAQVPMQGPIIRRGRPPSDSAAEDTPPAPTAPSPFDVAYPLTWYGGATDFASATPIRLEPGQTLAADVNLQPVQAIQIRIDNPPSARREGHFAQVMVDGPDGTAIPMNAAGQDGGRGYVLLQGLPPGHYQVEYLEFASSDKTQRRRHLSVDAMSNTRVPADAAPTIQMDGKVEPDQPIAERSITIGLREWPNGRSQNLSGQLAPDGTLSFVGISIERNRQYELYVAAPAGLLLTSVAAEGAKVSGRVITTGDSDVHLKLSVAHGKLGAVDGFVLRNDEGLPGVAVYLVPQDPTARATATVRDQSNTDGSFTMADVVPGSYYAIAIENGFDLMYANPEAVNPYLAAAQKVKVGVGENLELKIGVQPLR